MKNVEYDNDKILYETLLVFLQRNGTYFLNKPRKLVIVVVVVVVVVCVCVCACVCVLHRHILPNIACSPFLWRHVLWELQPSNYVSAQR